jgi:hypothetical protein
MMYAWSFAARTTDEIARLIRALGKHRYVREVDHRIHWTVDAALESLPTFKEHASRLVERCARAPNLDLASREPSLWRPASTDEVIEALTAFWTPSALATQAQRELRRCLERAGLEPATHAPFEASAEEPPYPELIQLDWVLWSVDELDADRHKGALLTMELAAEPVDASTPLYQEGPILAEPELCQGAKNGVLPADFFIWSEEPYSYADYVFRGAAKAAKLVDAPIGYRDL